MRNLWYGNLDDANECAMGWSADCGEVVRVFANDHRTRFYVERGPSFPLRNETILATWMAGKRLQKSPTYTNNVMNRFLDRE